jgi:uncharacterized protein (UPF0335 family)
LANFDVLGVNDDISVLLCCKITTGLLLITAVVCVRAAGNADAAIAAVQRQLEVLNKEVEQLKADLKEAYEEWKNAGSEPLREVCRVRYHDLKRKDEALDARREKLEAQLTPGVCMFVCAHCIIASTSAAPFAAVQLQDCNLRSPYDPSACTHIHGTDKPLPCDEWMSLRPMHGNCFCMN